MLSILEALPELQTRTLGEVLGDESEGEETAEAADLARDGSLGLSRERAETLIRRYRLSVS